MFRWCVENGPKLNAGMVALWFFQGIRTSIAKKSYILKMMSGLPGEN